MSTLLHRPRETSRFGSGGRRTPIRSAFRALFGFIHSVVLRVGKLIAAAAEIIADERMQRAMMEAEIYLNRHSRTTGSTHSKKST
jgi:hypothetical protein